MGTWIRRLAYLLTHARRDTELREEIEAHRSMRQSDLERRRLTASDADQASHRTMGNVVLAREEAHDVWIGSWSTSCQDIRHGVRSLWRDRGFAFVALVSLALGIGANAAIFSVVNGVILRPLPFYQPDRLVQVYGAPQVRGEQVERLDDYRQQSASFESLVGYAVSARYLHEGAERRRVIAVRAERPLFSLLRVSPLHGRTFDSNDPANVAVVGERFWEQHLSGAPTALGATITLDDERFTVIGVMSESFQFPYSSTSTADGVAFDRRADLWIPSDPPSDPQLRARSAFGYVVGRLKDGGSFNGAATELATIAQRMQAEQPDPYGPRGVRIERLSDAVLGPSVRRPLWLLFGAVGLVLLLTCVNVANLTLMRALRRRREIVVRAVLGAGPLRLVSLNLTESLLLACAGGAIALVLAWAGSRYVVTSFAAALPRVHVVSVDWHVALFLAAARAATSVIFGLAPALLAIGTDSRQLLTDFSDHATPLFGRVRDALVMLQVALAFVLTIGAAVLIRELGHLRLTDTGMVTRNVMTFHVGQRLRSARALGPSRAAGQFYAIADRVTQLPGVHAAGFTQMLPLQNWGWRANSADFRIRGTEGFNPDPFSMSLRYVTPGYFEALGIRLRAGRGFTASDGPTAAHAIVINEALARRQFGTGDPIGLETNRGRIIGIVRDVRQVHIGQPASPELYYPIAQNWSQLDELGMTLVVRVGHQGGIVEAVRSVVRDVNPNLAIFDVKSMDRVVDESL